MLHNNSLFPPDMNGSVILNTSHPIWESVVKEDPKKPSDTFYFCLSIGMVKFQSDNPNIIIKI